MPSRDHWNAKPSAPEPAIPLRARKLQLAADLAATVRLVWAASPGLLSLILFLSMLLALVPATSLWVGKLLLDEVARAVTGGFQNADAAYQRLAMLLAVQVGIAIFASLVQTMYGASRELLGDTLQNRISLRILHKAAGLDVESFENAETYDALRNAYNEVGSRPLGVMFQVIGIAQALIALASIGSLMARLGTQVLPLVLLASIPGVIVSSRFGAEGYRVMRRRATDARHQNYLGSLLTSDTLVKEVRLFGFEGYLLQRWQEYYRKFRAQFVNLLRRRSAWGLVATLGSSLLIAFATLSVLRRAAQGTITVGDFSLFVGGIIQIQSQFTGLLNSMTGIYESLLYMRNLFEFLELPSRNLDEGEEWRGPIDSIAFEHVSFRYPLTDRDVLADVSFSVRKGQALALVGENGAGKTTIVKLVTRLFEPTSGRILLNGMDASRFSQRSVQREMSIIFQDYGQYQMTARENIAISRTDLMADDASVQRAGQQSGAVEVVNDLPDGYETMLGRLFPGGRQLSGGQWQRLALGRLYFRPASVQIFDEPTAALDAIAEAAMIDRLREHGRDRLTLLISHRFSTVRLAEHIVVLHEGSVVESGSHEELVAQRGVYAKLFELQARGYLQMLPAK
ncbi:MAG TPA: ABC transporter ATP-binding protein [Vicinamibacterales bacterium]|nr:ABC transporter ATP-binding protein [Vicinamibacterales bacterium]